MAHRFGNQYRIAIGEETSYGSGFTYIVGETGSVRFDDLLVHSGMINMAPEIATAQTGFRSLTHIDTQCEEVVTTKSGTVTVSGSATAAILAKYIKGATVLSTDYRFPSDPSLLPSFVIYQLWSDTPSGSTYKAFATKGARLTELVISGNQGELIQFQATFTTQEIEREASVTITGTDPGISCTGFLQFADTSANFEFGGVEDFEAFSLTLTNELTADNYKFANNYTVTNPVIIRQGGEFSYTKNYNSAGLGGHVENIQNVPQSDILTIDGFGVIKIYSLPTSLELPDADRDFFKLNYSGKLIADAENAPINITLS